MGEEYSTNGREEYRSLMGKSEGKRPLGKPRRRWVDVGMNLGEVGWGDGTGLVWLRIGTCGELL
jgi:hypothetical protein